MQGKKFIAIGKIIMDTPGFDWNIPCTHYIINKTPSGMYEATNLEYILDSIGDTVKDAVLILVKLTLFYVMDIITNHNAYDELKESQLNNFFMEDYWTEYRKMEVELSGAGGGL